MQIAHVIGRPYPWRLADLLRPREWGKKEARGDGAATPPNIFVARRL